MQIFQNIKAQEDNNIKILEQINSNMKLFEQKVKKKIVKK